MLLQGQLVIQNCRGKLRTVWNNVALSDIAKLRFSRYTHDALKQACLDGDDLSRMHLMPAG